jgi:hypothetical protein
LRSLPDHKQIGKNFVAFADPRIGIDRDDLRRDDRCCYAAVYGTSPAHGRPGARLPSLAVGRSPPEPLTAVLSCGFSCGSGRYVEHVREGSWRVLAGQRNPEPVELNDAVSVSDHGLAVELPRGGGRVVSRPVGPVGAIRLVR